MSRAGLPSQDLGERRWWWWEEKGQEEKEQNKLAGKSPAKVQSDKPLVACGMALGAVTLGQWLPNLL